MYKPEANCYLKTICRGMGVLSIDDMLRPQFFSCKACLHGAGTSHIRLLVKKKEPDATTSSSMESTLSDRFILHSN